MKIYITIPILPSNTRFSSQPIQESIRAIRGQSLRISSFCPYPEHSRDAIDLNDLFSDREADNSLSSDSIPEPSLFSGLLLDNDFSTDQSSYCPSCRRNHPFLADSVTTSNPSSICTREYRLFRLHLQCENISEATSIANSTLGTSPCPAEDNSTSTSTECPSPSRRAAKLYPSDSTPETTTSYSCCSCSSEEHPHNATPPSRSQTSFANSRDRTISLAPAKPVQPSEVLAMLTY